MSSSGRTSYGPGVQQEWSSEAIHALIRRWADDHGGKAPSVTDWQRNRRGVWGSRNGPLPSDYMIYKLCGSWTEAVSGAGLTPLGRGVRGARRTEEGLKPYCSNGHLYTPSTTIYLQVGGNPARRCVRCVRNNERAVVARRHARRRAWIAEARRAAPSGYVLVAWSGDDWTLYAMREATRGQADRFLAIRGDERAFVTPRLRSSGVGPPSSPGRQWQWVRKPPKARPNIMLSHHTRWHVQRGIEDPACCYCTAESAPVSGVAARTGG